jgi:hypothetical protein
MNQDSPEDLEFKFFKFLLFLLGRQNKIAYVLNNKRFNNLANRNQIIFISKIIEPNKEYVIDDTSFIDALNLYLIHLSEDNNVLLKRQLNFFLQKIRPIAPEIISLQSDFDEFIIEIAYVILQEGAQIKGRYPNDYVTVSAKAQSFLSAYYLMKETYENRDWSPDEYVPLLLLAKIEIKSSHWAWTLNRIQQKTIGVLDDKVISEQTINKIDFLYQIDDQLAQTILNIPTQPDYVDMAPSFLLMNSDNINKIFKYLDRINRNEYHKFSYGLEQVFMEAPKEREFFIEAVDDFKNQKYYKFASLAIPRIEALLRLQVIEKSYVNDLPKFNRFEDLSPNLIIMQKGRDSNNIFNVVKSYYPYRSATVDFIENVLTKDTSNNKGLNLRNEILHGVISDISTQEAALIMMCYILVLKDFNKEQYV